MTEKEFWNDSYQTELVSTVTSVADNQITLSHTIFYAESGGQESDHGTMGGIEVLKAEKQGLDIVYTLGQAPSFAVGSAIETRIDWPRRYALMKLHFAAEVVLELFTQNFSIEKIGAHISADKSRIDFIWPESIAPLLPDIEVKAQQIIDADLPIISAFSDEAAQRRYWQVENFAKVPCGGTHLKRTSELGRITLKRKNLGKGKERVEIFVAD